MDVMQTPLVENKVFDESTKEKKKRIEKQFGKEKTKQKCRMAKAEKNRSKINSSLSFINIKPLGSPQSLKKRSNLTLGIF